MHIMTNIAIIGSGIGGLATAHYLKQLDKNYIITIYEKNNRIGGRIHSIEIDGHTVEIGAVYYHSINHYMNELVDDLNLPTKTLDRQPFGLWRDNEFVFKLGNSNFFNTIKMLFRYGLKLSKINSMISEIKDNLNGFYALENNNFDTIEEMTELFGFKEKAFEKFGQLLKLNGLTDKIIDELIEPTTRYVYHHAGTLDMNGFSGLVSMVAYDNAPVYYIDGGNIKICDTILLSNNFNVRMSSEVIETTTRDNKIFLKTTSGQEEFDYAVIATPVEVSQISVTNIEGINLSNRNYKGYTKTIIVGQINPSFFGEDTLDKVPPMILTKPTNEFPVYGFEKIGMGSSGYAIYEITSTAKLDDNLVENMFDHIEIKEELLLPYTFPNIEPVKKYDPIILSDRLYYISSIDSLSPSMESTLVVAKNIAKKIDKEINK